MFIIRISPFDSIFLTFQVHWKLSLIICLLDAYISWSNKAHMYGDDQAQFFKEKLFYVCFGLAFAGNKLYSVLLLILFGMDKKLKKN